MKTAIYGPVRASDIEDADLFVGIAASHLIQTENTPIVDTNLPVTLIALSDMMDYEMAVLQAEARLITLSDALIIRGGHPTLADRARRMGSLVYEVQ